MHQHFGYVSTLSPDQHPRVFADISSRARAFNGAHDIEGALLFDGERFVQWLQGPPEAMALLVERICKDVRHHEVSVLHRQSGPRWECHPPWACGFVGAEVLDRWLASLPGEQAFCTAFQTLLSQADLDV